MSEHLIHSIGVFQHFLSLEAIGALIDVLADHCVNGGGLFEVGLLAVEKGDVLDVEVVRLLEDGSALILVAFLQ